MTHTRALPLALIQLEVPPPQVVAQIGEQPVWFIDALQLQPDDYVIVRPHLGEELPAFDRVSGAILSGSWAMVTDHADWSERTAAWIRGAMEAELPLLGVCYGHQLMAYALGGKVGDNPNGWERGLKTLTQQAQRDPWLATLPGEFQAWLSHRQSVISPPQHAVVLAQSELDGCQILRYSPQALSVQFHPEFTRDIMTACLPAGVCDDGAQVAGEDWSRELLRRFWLQTRPQPRVQAQGA
ncbi:glutamine amidotransferase [Pantoea sp. BL1]|uniref:Glutamine amidotransferase n=1 Tax=Pantoea rwandensis TaxID=1076550 RepID=A0ABM5RKQ4_9GAMM|nr:MULTISPECIES: glutamine amidotransferase [Erwiniaceae]HAU5565005.1 glutamine amidotransferase [Serratia fonticola]AIR86595.1 glutamine amidotransferase [Pantoea rwandensis]KJV35016.1 glutamine amidotransferase [Pantoea sp. SM3]KJV47989.1 glutamine amidotransferase [Pantoea sp. BL1]MBK0090555.1 glutamine amidotransferase [Erwinia sp. S59]